MKRNWNQIFFATSVALNIISFPIICLVLGISDLRHEMHKSLTQIMYVNPTIVFVGDSITQDFYKINKNSINVSNIAMPGIGTSNVKLLVDKILKENPTIIFIMSGRNDMTVNYKVGNANYTIGIYKSILDKARLNNVKVVVTSTLYECDEEHPEIVDSINKFLQKYCIDNYFVFIDLNSRISENGKLKKEYSKDGKMHLNKAAYRVWQNMIQNEVQAKDTNYGLFTKISLHYMFNNKQ